MPPIRLAGYQHIVLLAVLAGFVLAASERPDSTFGRLLWVIDVGLFLLWQPIVSAERKLTGLQILVVLGVVLGLALQLNWGWLGAWGVFVASLVGGKVIVARSWRLGWFYLLAFGCIALVLFAWVSPQLFDENVRGRSVAPPDWVYWVSYGTLAVVAAVMPWGRVRDDAAVYDFLVSLLILLLLSFVLMLTNVLMAIQRIPHLDALVSSLLSLGLLILMLSWAWNPRLGFSGLGSLASRYLLRLGFPFDDWLRRVSDAFDREDSPDDFLREAVMSFVDLPWVVGGVASVSGREIARFGQEDRYRVRLEHEGVEVILQTAYRWTAALVWQANLLLKLVVDFHLAKQRDRQLRQMRYLEAVHETGSRVTHDVKNLLQSLEGLCYAVSQTSRNDSPELAELVRRQLPVITQRLRLTLDKLSSRDERSVESVPLSEWWGSVQERYLGQGIGFVQALSSGDRPVPGAVFDNVVDNLLANAIQKRSATPHLLVTVSIDDAGGACVVRVGDNGAAVDGAVAAQLFGGPVSSANGLGVGLYHSANLAARHGYRLRLANNEAGAVLFELAPRTS